MPSLKWCVFIFYTVVRSPAAVVTATFFSSEVYTSKRWSVSIFNSSAHPSTSGLVSCRTRTSSMATVYQDINIIRSKLWCVDTVCSVTSTYAMLFSAVRIFKILDWMEKLVTICFDPKPIKPFRIFKYLFKHNIVQGRNCVWVIKSGWQHQTVQSLTYGVKVVKGLQDLQLFWDWRGSKDAKYSLNTMFLVNPSKFFCTRATHLRPLWNILKRISSFSYSHSRSVFRRLTCYVPWSLCLWCIKLDIFYYYYFVIITCSLCVKPSSSVCLFDCCCMFSMSVDTYNDAATSTATIHSTSRASTHSIALASTTNRCYTVIYLAVIMP